MVLINVTQVLTRYFFKVSFIWAEDVSIYMLHWIVAFSIPMLWLTKDHMIMDVVDSLFPESFLRILDTVIDIFALCFGVVFAQKSMYSVNVNHGYHLSIVGYDEMWKYIPYVVSGVLLCVASLLNILETIAQRIDLRKEEKK